MLIATTAEDFKRPKVDKPEKSEKADKAERRRRKELKRMADDRALDTWERYRALRDHCDMLVDFTEIYDRRARFALLILGGLNAVNLLIVSRSDLMSSWQRVSPLIGLYVGCYALLSLCLLIYAISVLKPRPPASPRPEGWAAEGSGGLELTNALTLPTVGHYCQKWHDVQIGQLTRELSVMAYRRTVMNAAKVKALDRVYHGLYVLAALTATLIVAIGLRGI